MKNCHLMGLAAFYCLLGSNWSAAQSLYQDSKDLAKLLQEREAPQQKEDLWFRMAESMPCIYNASSEFIEFAAFSDTLVSYIPQDYIFIDRAPGADSVTVYDSDHDRILFSMLIKHAFCMLSIRKGKTGKEDALTVVSPSGEKIASLEGKFLGENIKIWLSRPGKLSGIAGWPGDMAFLRFNNFICPLNQNGDYLFPSLPLEYALAIKSGDKLLAEIRRDSIFFPPNDKQTYFLVDALGDTTPIRQFKHALPISQLVIQRSDILWLIFPEHSAYLDLHPLKNFQNLQMELVPLKTSNGQPPNRSLAGRADLMKINDFERALYFQRGNCGLFDQVSVGIGPKFVKTIPLSCPRLLKKIAYDQTNGIVNLTVERNLNKKDLNFREYKKQKSMVVEPDFSLLLIPTLRPMDYSCVHNQDVFEQLKHNDFSLPFYVCEIGQDGDTLDQYPISRSELTNKTLKKEVLYKITLDRKAAQEQSALDLSDVYFRIYDIPWYPMFDPTLEVFLKDTIAHFFYSPAFVEETFSIPVHRSDSLTVLLGAHSQLTEADLNSANLWGEISEKYKSNPFLRHELENELAKNSFEQLPGADNLSICKKLTQKTAPYRAWQKMVFENAQLKTEHQVSYAELVQSYRTRIPMASDRLEDASEQFGTESKKWRRSLRTADLAAGLSDFIVQRAQEELNIAFLDQFKERFLGDTAEFAILFPKTAAMMGEFDLAHYKTLLEFSKTAFVQDLRNLSVNFPKLFGRLSKYEKLRNDPKVYNLFLLYDIANKVYEDMPIDTVLLHVHSRLLERIDNLRDNINRKIGLGLEKDTASQQMMEGVIDDYMLTLNRFNVDYLQLETDYYNLLTQLWNDMFTNGLSEFINEKDLELLESLWVFRSFDSHIEEYRLLKHNVRGRQDYEYQKQYLPFNRYQEFFSNPPKVHETISSGLAVAKSHHLFSQESTQQYEAWINKLESGLQPIQNLRSELENRKANASISLVAYLPVLKKLRQLMIKKTSLELALYSEIQYLDPQAIHQVNSLVYLQEVLKHPENYGQYNWTPLYGFYDLVMKSHLDSVVIRMPDENHRTAKVEGLTEQLSAFKESRLRAQLAFDANKMNEEIERASTFLDKIAALMREQFVNIRPVRTHFSALADTAVFLDFVHHPGMTNGAIMLDQARLAGDLKQKMDARQLPARKSYLEANPFIRYSIQPNGDTVTIQPANFTGNLFLDNYGQNFLNETEASVNEVLQDEIDLARETIWEMQQIGRSYTNLMDFFETQYAADLLPSLRQAEQFDSLARITLLCLYAFKNGSNAVDSIVNLDTTLLQVTSFLRNGAEIRFDSLQINQRKIASGLNVRRWITPRQFNGIMEDTLGRKVFLGLLYQRLAALGAGPSLSSTSLALFSTKMMNSIYEIDDAREMLKYKKKNNQPLGFEDYYPFIRSTVDLLNIVLESPLSGDGRPLSDHFSMLKDVPSISNESLSLFENVFAENYVSAIRNVVQLLSIASEAGGNVSLRTPVSDKKRENAKVLSAILLYGSFMANIVGAHTPDQVKAAIRAVAVPPGNSSVKRKSSLNVDVNAYLGLHTSIETLNAAGLPDDQRRGGVVGLTAPVGLSVSWGQMGRKENQSFSLFVPILDLGAITTYRWNQSGVDAELPAFSFGNLVSPGMYLLWNAPKTPLSVGAGAQFGPQLRKINLAGTERESSAWRFGLTAAVDVPIFNLFTRRQGSN